MATTANDTWFSDSLFCEEVTKVIFDNEGKESEDFVSYTVGETDESPTELSFNFETPDEGLSSLTLSLTEGKVVVTYLIKDKGNSEVTPQVWSLAEDLEIFLEELAEKHGIEITYSDNHGKQI